MAKNKSGDNTLKPNRKERETVDCVVRYREEAETARRERIDQNRENFDCYHLRQNWSHKIDGQSREFLAIQASATEQISQFMKQGLVDLGKWFDVEGAPGIDRPRITPESIQKILEYQLDKNKFYNVFDEALKLGLLSSLMIFKVHGKWVTKPKYVPSLNFTRAGNAKPKLKIIEDKVWQLAIDPIAMEDCYIDPTGRGLYVVHEMTVDMFDVEAMVKSESNPNGIYDGEVVKQIKATDVADLMKQRERDRISGQNTDYRAGRPKVKLYECWGTILDRQGKVLYENAMCTIANDKWLIQKPIENPFWHQRIPFVIAPIIRVPKSVNHKALMDAGTKHNKALNEIYNLNLDSGIMAAYGIKQLRASHLEDESEVANGVMPGQTLKVSDSLPIGAAVLERVDTGGMSAESLAMFNLTKSEAVSSMLTNDARLGGAMPRDTKATEIVETSQSITTQLNGIATAIENDFLRPMLELALPTCMQHMDNFDAAEVQKLLGPAQAGVLQVLTPVQRFVETVNGTTFRVFGISYTLNKIRDFRRLTGLLQTVFSNQILVEAFVQKYDPTKLLDEIMRSLDIDTAKLSVNQQDMVNLAMQQLLGGGGGIATLGQLAGAGGAPNVASQIPTQEGARSTGGSSVPAPNFPASRATPSGTPGGT